METSKPARGIAEQAPAGATGVAMATSSRQSSTSPANRAALEVPTANVWSSPAERYVGSPVMANSPWPESEEPSRRPWRSYFWS